MDTIVGAAVGLPSALFSVPLLAVLGYWLLVLSGRLEVDALDRDTGPDARHPPGASRVSGILAGFGLGGVPASVALSVLVTLAWAGSVIGKALLDANGADVARRPVLAALLAVAAILLAWLATRLALIPLRGAFELQHVSRRDLLGQICVTCTARVDRYFGQAAVTARNGAEVLIQVRQGGDEPLVAGSSALIFDYDSDGEFFWIAPYNPDREADRAGR